jgi:ATP-dependent RNA helicase RhlB
MTIKFTELDLDANLQRGIAEAGFIQCMPVQEKTFTHALKYTDVCVQSQTGTGKTAVFLISIYHNFINKRDLKNSKALIIAPTRELAIQIEKEAKVIGKYLDFTCGCFYGGVGYAEQEKLLKDGVDIIIGTPGRLIDFNQQKKLDLRKTGFLVIDEADRLFDMGFLPDIKKMLKNMPHFSERISMLFSATLSYRAKELAWEFMNNPVEIEIAAENITVDKISQKLYHVGKEEKMKLLLGILKSENPENCIVFTNTKSKAHEVSKRLEYNGYKCEYIMGDLQQSKRLKIIESIKSGELKYLVATDVAARGLHVDDLEMVINYDLPNDAENYVHRIGRTARAGKEGKAISLACEKFVYALESIEALTNTQIPVEWPDENMFEKDLSAGKHFRLEKERHEPHHKKVQKPGATGRKKPLAHKTPIKKQTSNIKSHPVKKHSDIKVSTKEHRIKKVHKSQVPKRTHEERLEYYREKYGENFTPAVIQPEGKKQPEGKIQPGKKSFLKKIFGLFTKD